MLLNGDGGWINGRLKNLRETRKNLQKHVNQTNVVRGSFREQTTVLSDEEARSLLVSLKSVVAHPGTIESIIQKLNFTRQYRKKLLLDREFNLKEWFPFFFTNPELVRLLPSFQALII